MSIAPNGTGTLRRGTPGPLHSAFLFYSAKILFSFKTGKHLYKQCATFPWTTALSQVGEGC